jgi:signal transduction histidine kinase
MLWYARQYAGRMGRALMLLGLGVMAHGCADLAWVLLQRVFNLSPFPSVADFFFLACPLLLLSGVWCLFEFPPYHRQMFKINLEIEILMVCVYLLCWEFFGASHLRDFGSDWLALVLSTATPVLDLLILGLLLRLIISRQGPKSVLVLSLGPLALILLIIADFRFFVLSSSDSYISGGLWDLCWSGAAIALGLAVHLYFHWGENEASLKKLAEQVAHFSNFFPYPAIVFSYAILLINQGSDPLLFIGSLLASAVITLMVVTRQAVGFQENLALTHQLQSLSAALEQRVQERTQELEESREKLVATEKLATIGRLTAGLAHEINTPLAASMNHLHQAQELVKEYGRSIGVAEVTPQDHQEIAQELKQSLDGVQGSLDRLGEFVRKMRSMGRNPSGNSVAFDPVKVIDETIALLTPQANNAQVSLYCIPPAKVLSVYGESGRLSQVLTNLINNAIHACEDRRDPEGSWVEVFLGHDERFLTIAVQDNGSGIPEAVRSKIFEPMFTTKDVGRGTGLGLSIIQDIVKGHFEGRLNFETQVGVGSTFKVQIPLERTREHNPGN